MKPVPLVTKWWTVIRRMKSGAIGMESIGPVKAYKDEKPYAIMPWSYFRAMQRIVREVASKKCESPLRDSWMVEPVLVNWIDCGNCLSCQARKVMKK